MIEIIATAITREGFAPFGAVIEAGGQPDFMINRGRCGRFHDQARPAVTGDDSAVALSVAKSEIYALPHRLDLMERHPLGSQAFVPMGPGRCLITVAPDDGGRPGMPAAFIAGAGQGVQYRANVWHGVLTPLDGDGLYLIVDRVGPGNNLEEVVLDTPYLISEGH